jgi:Mg/Co/Ni transporter MgtE
MLNNEAFKDRVKSLLNLEEDELAPILEKMTSNQLVRLYTEAGNTQREKILRALNSERAARLITEVML